MEYDRQELIDKLQQARYYGYVTCTIPHSMSSKDIIDLLIECDNVTPEYVKELDEYILNNKK